MKSPAAPASYRNRLLASLPPDDLKKLEPDLQPLVFERNQTLDRAGEAVETVYFLEEGICSVVAALEDGGTVEVGIIGRDNFVGLSAVLGTDYSVNRSFIQIPGSGYGVKADILVELCSDRSGKILRGLQRGVQGLLTQTAQTAACNRIHETEERLARWLLMCHDRIGTDVLPITHEFLATMLGTRRSTVTVVAGILQQAGFIEYSRGAVKIVNRAGLEEASCECYSTVYNEYVRLGLL